MLLSIEDHPGLAELADADLDLGAVPMQATEPTRFGGARAEASCPATVLVTVAVAGFVAGYEVGAG